MDPCHPTRVEGVPSKPSSSAALEALSTEARRVSLLGLRTLAEREEQAAEVFDCLGLVVFLEPGLEAFLMCVFICFCCCCSI